MFTSKLKIARLLQQGDYVRARKKLALFRDDHDTLYWRSLLLRLEGNFTEEARLVHKACRRYPQSSYFTARREWHAKPILERIEPRPALKVERKPEETPSRAILDDLLFVSGANSGYFHHLVQLLESLARTSLYAVVPIGIVDCGLTPSEIRFLRDNFGIENFQTPEWQIEEGREIPMSKVRLCSGHKAILSKPFLTTYFPSQKYVMWFDADSWVHDERAIDRYLLAAERTGIGITSFQADGHTHVATGVFAVCRESEVIAAWQKLFLEELNKNGFMYALEEIALSAVLRQFAFNDFLPASLLYRIWIEGMPYVKPNDPTLYAPIDNSPISIYAFDAHTDKSVIFWPTQERKEGFMSTKEIRSHKRNSSRALRGRTSLVPGVNLFRNQTSISLYFRDWPRGDQPSLQQALAHSIENYLAST